jgi:small-conductance mechanosensitive channel/CRP-like cAMP-binding protein
MDITYTPVALLAAIVITVLVLRSGTASIRLTWEMVLVVAIAGYMMTRGTTPLTSGTYVTRGSDGGWLRALAVLWWLLAARLLATLTVMALGRNARSRQARLFSDLVAGAIYLTAALIVLNSVLDLPIRGLLATSGVIAIVLGLALQNTLADVFSGIAVGLEQPFHIGDRVTIGDHAEGFIVEINWRSIRVQTDGEDLATIPNSVVAKTQIINRSVPTQRRMDSIDIPTSSFARPEMVMELMRQAILLCPAILEGPPPSVLMKYAGTRTTTLCVKYFVANTPALEIARSQLLCQVRRLSRHADQQSDGATSCAILLANVTLFESLAPAQIDLLSHAVVHHRFDAGETLFEQGSHGAALFVIASGIFEITSRDNEGSRRTCGRIGPGDYIGEISMMTGDPRPGTVTALCKGEVVELPGSAVEALLRQDDTLSNAMEASVRRALILFKRDDETGVVGPGPIDTMLNRILSFLGQRNS